MRDEGSWLPVWWSGWLVAQSSPRESVERFFQPASSVGDTQCSSSSTVRASASEKVGATGQKQGQRRWIETVNR